MPLTPYYCSTRKGFIAINTIYIGTNVVTHRVMQPRSVSVHGFYFSNTIAKDCVPAAPAGRGARGPGPPVPAAPFPPAALARS